MAANPPDKRPAAPLLHAYLRSIPGDPPHVPAWVNPVAWAVFGTIALLAMGPLNLECTGLFAAIGLGYLTRFLLVNHFKPRNLSEKADQVAFGAIRKYKTILAEGTLTKKLPVPVLIALENAVQAYNTSMARLQIDDPVTATEQSNQLRQSLHSCFVAALPVLRDHDASKREWRAICDNQRLVSDVVEAIERQTVRLQGSRFADNERLAALRELDDLYEDGMRLRD